MRLNTINILGVTITTNPKNEILEYVRKYLTKSQKSSANWRIKSQKLEKKPLIIVTPNPEQVVLAQKDKHFAQVLNQADVAIPDGIGISLAVKFLNAKWHKTNDKLKLKRIAGVEFMEDLVEMASKQGYRIGLIGGRDGVAVGVLECLQQKYSNLKGWAENGPEITVHSTEYTVHSKNRKETNSSQQCSNITIEQSGEVITQQYIQDIIEKIASTETSLVFVGLGAPKQEYLIEKVKSQKSKVKSPLILMSVGGSFDILAGRIPRAPFALRALGLEWPWRLAREPWRWRRQFALIKFLRLVIYEKLA